MPETMSAERRMLLSAYGAKLVLTPGAEGMAGAVKKAEEILQTTPGAVLAGQFDNPANPVAHEQTTGPEIWTDLGGRLAAIVAGVGTGGTITGTARYLKRQNPAVRAIAVEPAASPLLSQGRAGAHGIMGIGANFVPKALDRDILDEILTVTDDEARKTAREMAKREGVLVGISRGARRWRRQNAWRKTPPAQWSPSCRTAASATCPRVCLKADPPRSVRPCAPQCGARAGRNLQIAARSNRQEDSKGPLALGE